MHATLIAVHATAASVALLAGLAAFRWPGLVGVHSVGTLLMGLALGGALWVGRGRNPPLLDAVYLALLVLAVVMSWRSIQAWRCRPCARETSPVPFVAALGSTCISLTTGLLAVAALRTGWGPGAVVAAGVLPTVLGRIPLNRAIRRRRGTAALPRRGTSGPDAA